MRLKTWDAINDLVEYIPTKTIKDKADTVAVPLNAIAKEIVDRYTGQPDDKLVQDPNLVSALNGHVEGSRAFARYRTIDIDMKKDHVKIFEGKN